MALFVIYTSNLLLSPSLQTLREEKQAYEKELMNLRSKYEEDTAHFKESQSRALEELSKKHRAALESTQSSAEKEKGRLLAVSLLAQHTYLPHMHCLSKVWGDITFSFVCFSLHVCMQINYSVLVQCFGPV